ncbi:DUF3037 domain-containing protein [Staphylococcus warneri]|uniref:DUF3037 domain-containing protein n=1 Tax=Staphylococcus warneri TaxID=1292 RepID=UPI002DB7178C|nr:DUF3037 domain-containing protein [Staphylococcus warneri]MEB7383144.1 DUF3037 domain-containing protein [Staphylococcus warneri]
MDRGREIRQKGKYTIIRFVPDVITGEVINVGIILHTEEGIIKFKMIDNDSKKIKAFNKVHALLYLSIKNKLEYYLENTQGTVGAVGKLNIASPINRDFLPLLIEYFSSDNLKFTELQKVISKDFIVSFNSLYERYIDKESDKIVTENTKTRVSKLFEERNYIGTKIKENYKITPIRDFQEISMKIDFVYKNGVWNYLQVVPNLKNNKQKLDFLAEMKLLYSSINNDDKIRFIYNGYDLETIKIISYFENESYNIEKINFLDNNDVNILLDDIENHANDNIEELIQVV